MTIREFKDCEQVTDPKDQDIVYYVLQGTVYLIERELTFKAIKADVRRARKNAAKEAELLQAEAIALGNTPNQAPTP